MFERDLSQSEESLEPKSEGRSEQELDGATHEAEAHIEKTRGHEEAEVVEGLVKDLVEGKQDQVKQTGPPGTSEAEVEKIKDPESGDEATPINLPDTQQGAADISEKVIEKELPEGGQQYEEPGMQKDLDAGFDGDLSSLMPGEGELTDPLGKEKSDTSPGSELGIEVGFGKVQGIDSSSENPTGEEHPGLGPFKPGKGPGGGTTEGGGADVHISATVYTPEQVRQLELDAMDLSRGHDNIRKFNQVKGELNKIYDSGGDGKKGAIVMDDPPAPKPKTSTQSSTPDGQKGTNVMPPTQEEMDRVLEKTSGDEISVTDPDSQGGGEPDGVLPKYAEQVKDAMDRAGESKGKQKKAGSEVVTDPDHDQPGSGGEGGPTIGKETESRDV